MFICVIKVKFWLACVNTVPVTDIHALVSAQILFCQETDDEGLQLIAGFSQFLYCVETMEEGGFFLQKWVACCSQFCNFGEYQCIEGV